MRMNGTGKPVKAVVRKDAPAAPKPPKAPKPPAPAKVAAIKGKK